MLLQPLRPRSHFLLRSLSVLNGLAGFWPIGEQLHRCWGCRARLSFEGQAGLCLFIGHKLNQAM